jgi:hypothetical protein
MASNENEVLQPHRRAKVRTFLRKYDDTTPEAGAFWAVLFRHVIVSHTTAVAVAQELEASERTVGDVLTGWRPASLVPSDERRPWHADGCPGAHDCNCGGGLTDDEVMARAALVEYKAPEVKP